MQWEFRKTLDNFESYKANSQTFIGEVYRGDPGVLNTLVREMELIISDPKEKIPSKVLAMRVKSTSNSVCQRHYDFRQNRRRAGPDQAGPSHAEGLFTSGVIR